MILRALLLSTILAGCTNAAQQEHIAIMEHGARRLLGNTVWAATNEVEAPTISLSEPGGQYASLLTECMHWMARVTRDPIDEQSYLLSQDSPRITCETPPTAQEAALLEQVMRSRAFRHEVAEQITHDRLTFTDEAGAETITLRRR